MDKNPFLTPPGVPEMPNVQPAPIIDSDALSTDMGMQLFPSAMNNFGNTNSLPGVSPENIPAYNQPDSNSNFYLSDLVPMHSDKYAQQTASCNNSSKCKIYV